MEHYIKLLDKFELEETDYKYLKNAAKIVLEKSEPLLMECISVYYNSGFQTEKITDLLNQIAKVCGINIYTVNFIFLAMSSERMHADFITKGYSEELFWETIMDLKYKLYECKQVKGVLGNFVMQWYPIFYRLDLFKLGRLEYEKILFPFEEYRKDGITIKKGDPVLSVHIPSSGPLSIEDCKKSLRRAYEFFEIESGNHLVCICNSWLLYDKNRKILPEKSNIIKFMNLWDIISSTQTPTFNNAWRVFGYEYDGHPKNLPETTGLQKSIKHWLIQDKQMGEGSGVLIYDGKNII